jgi:hypothetical protein
MAHAPAARLKLQGQPFPDPSVCSRKLKMSRIEKKVKHLLSYDWMIAGQVLSLFLIFTPIAFIHLDLLLFSLKVK